MAAKTIELSVTGIDAMKAALAALGPKAQDALAAELYRTGERVMTEAKRQTPVDTGALKASGFVNEPERNGDEVSVTLGFGGAASAYALVQHEDLTLRHTVGGPKFLERPFLETAKDLPEALAERLQQRLGT